ncbi:MAG: peptide-methionine (S)-S-oxide reductase MsrA [Anaerolineae bacterium]|nr:peptide-methionine (S)-S-oxide reductase MsrA [Anaerolineae bacterium]
MNTQMATLAGGCFWCLEAVFDEVKGVQSVESGYAGGHVENPDYSAICTGTTGHAEIIQINFDPEIVSYQDLLHVFFGIHDPTTLNRQGGDVGTQYRSAIFYHNDEQKELAEQVIKDLETQNIWDNPIVTTLEKLEKFYIAEDYHQEYFAKNPFQGYCQAVVAPKVTKFRKQYSEMLKKEQPA